MGVWVDRRHGERAHDEARAGGGGGVPGVMDGGEAEGAGGWFLKNRSLLLALG